MFQLAANGYTSILTFSVIYSYPSEISLVYAAYGASFAFGVLTGPVIGSFAYIPCFYLPGSGTHHHLRSRVSTRQGRNMEVVLLLVLAHHCHRPDTVPIRST